VDAPEESNSKQEKERAISRARIFLLSSDVHILCLLSSVALPTQRREGHTEYEHEGERDHPVELAELYEPSFFIFFFLIEQKRISPSSLWSPAR